MAISIPSNITLNRRDYGIGEAIKLNDADLPADEKHPLVVYCLKYIASPVSSGLYSQIEDHFGNYLDSGLMERIANDDSEFDFNKEEYDKHLSSVKKYMKELTLETLILKLKPYVGGENKKWISANIRGTQKEGLDTSISDFSNIGGRQKALSFNVKGEVSAKINQAIRRDLPYYPALQYFVDRGHKSSKYERDEDTENLEDIEGVIVFEKDDRKYKWEVKLPDRKTLLELDITVFTLTIDMGKVFEEIAQEQGLSYIAKSYNSLMKAFSKFKFHPDNNIKSEIIEDKINSIYEFNDILRQGTFDSDEDGLRYTEEQRRNAIKEGDFEIEMKKFEKLKEQNLISNKTYVDFKNGKRFTSFPVDKDLLNFVQLNIDFKRNLPENKDKSPSEYYNDIELLFQRKSAARTRAEITRDARIEQSSVISATSESAYSERQFFIDESWKTPDEVKLNFDALKYNRELNDVFKKLLIPSDSTLILSFFVAEKNRQSYSTKNLTDEDKKKLIDSYLDVVRVDKDYEFESKKYDATPLREIRPSFETRGSKLEQENLKLKLPSKQGKVQVRDSKDKGGETIAREKARGILDAGLPSTNFSSDLNAFIYYIMRQTNKLEGKLGGEII